MPDFANLLFPVARIHGESLDSPRIETEIEEFSAISRENQRRFSRTGDNQKRSRGTYRDIIRLLGRVKT